MPRCFALFLLLLPQMGCQRESTSVSTPKPSIARMTPSPWPALPGTSEQVQALLREMTRRPPAAQAPPAEPSGILRQLSTALPKGQVFAGWRQIVARIEGEAERAREAGAPLWLLWGTYHDAPLQVEAFRRLVGPTGVSNCSVALEAFDARGRWRGLEAEHQKGDDERLVAYLAGGGRAALLELQVRQRRDNYTGWKYGYIPQLVDLLLQARASKTALWPCDMSRALQRRLRSVSTEEQLMRLRELHCYLSLRARTKGVRAMLWGQDHIGREGFSRFMRPEARVIALYVFGGRKSPSALARRLAPHLALSTALMITGSGDDWYRRWVLLLPGEALGGHVERHRDVVPKADPQGLNVRAPHGSVLRVGRRRVVLTRSPQPVPLKAGERVFALEHDARFFVGSLDLAREGTLELEFTPKQRRVEMTLRAGRSTSSSPPRVGR
ncbi:MAG: hypothetical protein JRH20_09750 [Deltaproteobacteria bacterium]|nr:hypothetical protein [Deltaproteobacteria bacterium]